MIFIRTALAVMLLSGLSVATFAASTADDEGGGEYLEKLTGINLHGFANMGYANDTSDDLHRRYSRGFQLNNFDMYYSPDLGNRVRFLSEVVFEPDAENQQPSFDAERLQAGYVVNKYLTVWIGRFHTPIGYYVIAYHHGMLLQTAVEKPRFLDFEDHYGILPVHTNGIWLNGNFTVGDERFAAMAWFGNADRLVTDGNGFTSLDFDMHHNDGHHLAVGARGNWVSGAIDGLQVGATVLSEKIDYQGSGQDTYGPTDGLGHNDYTANPNLPGYGYYQSNFLMYGVHATYEAHGIEFLNEAYAFDNTSPTVSGSKSYKSFAGYSQLAYWIHGTQAPYVRYERGNFDSSDPYFLGQYNGLPYTKGAVGYRYNVDENAAIKVELSRTTFDGSTNTNIGQSFSAAHFDYSIRF